MNCVSDSSLYLLPKQCAGFIIVTKLSNCVILNLYCIVWFWLVRLQTKKLNQCTILRLQLPLIIDQTILKFHHKNPVLSIVSPCTLSCGVHCAPCLLCSVVHCTVYSGVQCALCRVQLCLLQDHRTFQISLEDIIKL